LAVLPYVFAAHEQTTSCMTSPTQAADSNEPQAGRHKSLDCDAWACKQE
jgi:hypothetical protein